MTLKATASAVLVGIAILCSGCAKDATVDQLSSEGAKTNAASPSPSVDRSTIDQVLKSGAAGVALFGSIQRVKNVNDFGGVISQAQSNFSNAAAQLSPAPEGVPESTARGATAAFRRLSDSLGALAACVAQNAGPSECAVTVEEAGRANKAAAEAILDLVPFSSMSQAEVAALFEAGSGGDAAETALSEADRLASEACDLFVAAGIAGRIGSPETLAAFGEASSAASAAAVQEDRWMELAEKIELVALGFSGKATVDELDAGMTGMNDVTAFCREFD